MDVKKLRIKMLERDVNVDALAEMIGVDRSSLYRKLHNSEKVTIGEAKRIKAALALTDDEASAIFLP